MRRIEMVALRKDVERKVGEDLARSLGHPGVVVRVAAAAEREVDGLCKVAQAVEAERR